ncbi:MAG: DUF4295 domain-containing protein [Bacteroidales bacterium]
MAKKSVATFGGDRASIKKYVKCIRMQKSEKSGSYIFKEEQLPIDGTKEFFDKK